MGLALKLPVILWVIGGDSNMLYAPIWYVMLFTYQIFCHLGQKSLLCFVEDWVHVFEHYRIPNVLIYVKKIFW